MKNFVIAAVAILTLTGFVTSAEAESKALAFTSAPKFVQELKSSGQFEMESSTVALQKSNNNGVKTFAQKMIDDHKAADEKLTETLKQANLPQPKYAMLVEQRDMLSTLIASEGAAFDRNYVEGQIQAHRQAINLLDTYSKRGDNEALKQLASNLLPTIKEHLKLAEDVRPKATARR